MPAGGFPKLMEAFDLERCGNATMALGQAAGALEDAMAYVQERRQFGKPLVDFQAVQMKLAEMAMEVEAARLLIYRAAVSADNGLPSIVDSRIAKCFANEMCAQRDRQGGADDGRLRLFGGKPEGAAHARRMGLGYRGRRDRHPEGQHRQRDGRTAV